MNTLKTLAMTFAIALGTFGSLSLQAAEELPREGTEMEHMMGGNNNGMMGMMDQMNKMMKNCNTMMQMMMEKQHGGTEGTAASMNDN